MVRQLYGCLDEGVRTHLSEGEGGLRQEGQEGYEDGSLRWNLDG